MCPACLAAAAWAVAGTTSAGGLTMLVARKFRGKKAQPPMASTLPVAPPPRDEQKDR